MIRDKWQVDQEYKEYCMEVLVENLAALRAKAGITQEELANVIGVSRQTYYAVETKRRALTWNTYLSLVLFFDTNINTHILIRDMNAYPMELMRKMTN